jgi:spermidine/putrescine transport system substrate-binding protein
MRLRRRFAWIGAAAAAAALAVAALWVGVASPIAQQDCKQLHLFTWEGEADPSFVKPFEKQYGVKVTAAYISTEDQELAKMVAGGTKLYDVVTVASDNRKQMSDAGVIKPLETSRLTNFKDLLPFLKPAYNLNGKVWAVPADWGVNPFIYNTKTLKKQPTGWEILWSPQLKDQVGIWGDYSLIYIGATVLGYDRKPGAVFNLSDAQLDAIKKKMLTLKPNVRKVWSTGGDLIQLFANGEINAAMGWNYVYQQLAGKKFPVRQLVFRRMGGQGWSEGPGLSAGIKPECEDLAYKWINYLTSPKAQAGLASVTGYTPTNPKAKGFMSAALIKQTGIDKPHQAAKGAIIRLDPVDRKKYVKVAEEIIAGLQ